ncbi:hypothetical protein DEO72_LG2g4743 [Vigna unguiculata]|uniref:Uncharacterized protein n=1 Tax=Vigna unguiculata TaxID=3917 RepID=A0A4D6L793_VIGUN|nr:hypothetical protein DEO72_LG2g4743 [Vigna unguiculata]
MQAKGSLGSDHVEKEKVYKKSKNSAINSITKIVHQPEPACALKKKGKAAYEDAEMDPEIQHLIKTLFWEIDNCPQSLTEEMAIKLSDSLLFIIFHGDGL